MQYASVGSIGNVERLSVVEDEDGSPVLDSNGEPVLDFQNKPVIAYYTQNVPSSTIKGIELEFDWKPYPSGRITGYVTWTDAKVTDDWNTKWITMLSIFLIFLMRNQKILKIHCYQPILKAIT